MARAARLTEAVRLNHREAAMDPIVPRNDRTASPKRSDVKRFAATLTACVRSMVRPHPLSRRWGSTKNSSFMAVRSAELALIETAKT